ncbi:LytR/AlgR family response regulator transcription factor [Brumimicrobium oceani]|uniref:DNA-binding response regulator n=1 Tax=Brumimicrobium oceani TaxID=2100725 RepID=A0A2U2X0E0_9FLAO|nr:LytTR family DNA-binding domain-containing protein [Brumimicrobium oceani]PWH81214.1 DNA-binding response regulator [Brumimicrobium oceani]
MQNTYNAILVDDEQSARNILSNLILNFCPQINIVDKCEDVEQAVESIKKHKPDLVFLDIEMPNYSGYEITLFFDQIDFEIIFVTAYDHYAIKAFQVAAVDYLLKPIDIGKLKTAIDKFITKQKHFSASVNYEVLVESLKENKLNKIIIPFQGDQKVVRLNEIIAIEACESYSFIHLMDGNKYIVSKNLKHFETLFDENPVFFRTHKSWIVNTSFLKFYSKSNLSLELENKLVAKLSKYKKASFEKSLLR